MLCHFIIKLCAASQSLRFFLFRASTASSKDSNLQAASSMSFSIWLSILCQTILKGTKSLHPGRLTLTIIMEVWKIIFLSKWVICRFHVNLPGCIGKPGMQRKLCHKLWRMSSKPHQGSRPPSIHRWDFELRRPWLFWESWSCWGRHCLTNNQWDSFYDKIQLQGDNLNIANKFPVWFSKHPARNVVILGKQGNHIFKPWNWLQTHDFGS